MGARVSASASAWRGRGPRASGAAPADLPDVLALVAGGRAAGPQGGRAARRRSAGRSTSGRVPIPAASRNFPLQANGAEMLRLACCSLTEAGVRVCAPVHDALLIEAPADDIEQAVAVCQQAMQQASELVLRGFPLRTEAKVVRHPDRYMDPRGHTMWDMVFGLLDPETVARCA